MKTQIGRLVVLVAFSAGCSAMVVTAGEAKVAKEVLRDKIGGYWIGQLAGNYLGFPFENVYVDEPVPVDRYYNGPWIGIDGELLPTSRAAV